MNEIVNAVASPPVVGALVAGVLIVLAVLAFVIRLQALEKKIDASLARHNETRHERDRPPKETRDELAQMKGELHGDIESLRSIVRSTASDTQRLIAHALSESRSRDTNKPSPNSSVGSQAYDNYEESRGAEDGVAQLLSIANRIVQQSSTTLDAFRLSTGALATHVSGYPNPSESVPTAFIVEHRGSYYAIPNVVKPARLPKEWFNRSEFGVNDEIQQVLSLPRLRRRGSDYDVQEPGVFAR